MRKDERFGKGGGTGETGSGSTVMACLTAPAAPSNCKKKKKSSQQIQH